MANKNPPVTVYVSGGKFTFRGIKDFAARAGVARTSAETALTRPARKKLRARHLEKLRAIEPEFVEMVEMYAWTLKTRRKRERAAARTATMAPK